MRGIVWVALATAVLSPSDAGAANPCTYLRLSLSTPQRLAKAPEDAPLQARYREVFAHHLTRAGFQVTTPTQSRFAWEIFTQVERVDTGRLAWSYAFLPMPGVLDGAIEFPTFSVIDRERGKRLQFTTYHGLDHFRATEFPLKAALESERLANLYLPVARELCAERESPSDEGQRLERIRSELAAKIERVRIEQQKRLDLRVEPADE